MKPAKTSRKTADRSKLVSNEVLFFLKPKTPKQSNEQDDPLPIENGIKST